MQWQNVLVRREGARRFNMAELYRGYGQYYRLLFKGLTSSGFRNPT
jgi:hypothetical protein